MDRFKLGAVAGAAALGVVACLLLLRGAAPEAGAHPEGSPGVDRPAGDGGARTAGTLRMVERLREIAESQNPLANAYLNAARAEMFASVPTPQDPALRAKLALKVASELLNAGRTDDAVERLEELSRTVADAPGASDPELARALRSLLAVAYLRQGEQSNCIRHHGTDSCLLPIRGNGVHKDQRGSRAAIRELTAILEAEPHDLAARWLLNIAYMTVGEYPGRVPAPWLIPPRAFESDHDIGRFTDVAAAVGLDVRGLAGAALMDDFDGDGLLDVIVTSWGARDPMHFLRNAGDGTFRDASAEAGLEGLVSGLNAVHADYDNDGDLDVYVTRGAWRRESGLLPPSLLRNDGFGRFDDVTEEAGLLSLRPTQSATWGDYDNDGWVDLFVATESYPGEPEHPTELYHNEGDGTFTEVAQRVGVQAIGYFKGAVWGDYDNDGLLDLYVTELRREQGNLLFRNAGSDGRGGWSFEEVGERAGVREPAYSFPAWFFDYDNDGWLDLFVSGYAANTAAVAAEYLGLESNAEKPRLYRNRGDGTFDDVTREARVDKVLLTMGCNFGDLDNDGWLDFYAGTGDPDFRSLVPNRMFRNAGGRFFQDVTTSGGFGHLQKGHGIAFGDLDNDGDEDVFLKAGGAFEGDVFQSALFRNPGHGNRWLTLKLVGTESNRAAIGARIRVTIEEPDGVRSIHRTVTSGSSFGGSSLQQEIGLGRAQRIREVEIAWPASGLRQVFRDLEPDRAYEIRERSSRPRPMRRPALALGPSD